jgi:hypothetical protein
MVHNALDLGPGESGIQGDGGEPTLLRSQLPAHHVDVVRQGVGENVAGGQTPGPEAVDELVGPAGQLGERERDARRTGHHRRLIGVLLGEIPESEPPIPRVLHGE